MFGKKQPPPAGRQRPQATADRRSVVFSYSASRNVRPSGANGTGRDIASQQRNQGTAERRPGAPRPWLKRLPVLLGLLLLAGLLVNSIFLSATPRFERVDDKNGPVLLRDPQVYEQAAAQLLGDSLGNRTKLTIRTEPIAQKLAAQFPELGTVTIALPVFGHQPVLRAQPAVPALIMGSGTGQSYVLDTSGRAIMATAQAAGVSKLGLPMVADQSGLSVRSGQQALPSTTVSFITEVVGQMKAAKLTVSSLTMPKGTSELAMRLEGQPYFVKFNLRGNARAEAGAFLAVKKQLEREDKKPGEYIDVRVEGRAYYK